MTTMTGEKIKELAMRIEQSDQKFIWVLRDVDKGDIFVGEVKREKLPEGFEERVKEVGMVVRDWAPQVEILGHLSTSGFMSHCGWNSRFKSLTMGVPIAAWPMHSDQPKNAFLVTNTLKVGMVANTWELREEIVTSSTIAKVVKKLIASKEGEEIKKRAEELASRVFSEGVEAAATTTSNSPIFSPSPVPHLLLSSLPRCFSETKRLPSLGGASISACPSPIMNLGICDGGWGC
ncbi:zeatin O-xylosyltransferase-like [Rhododendron vialii]|uniref:zeatin O-xylosyltransferase-like n=1 Tax=Rhododendron vialii TaxID=182163 RepID=UPI00265E1F48|nr:zeatin O-xylosyltransferase-like [Rhododendron vialii]